MIRECLLLLSNVHLQVDTIDMRQLGRSDAYSVCGVYTFLTSYQVQTSVVVSDLVWNKDVALKVSVFVWRLLSKQVAYKR